MSKEHLKFMVPCPSELWENDFVLELCNSLSSVCAQPSVLLVFHCLHYTAILTGNWAVHAHAEPQPRASRCLRARDQILLRLQGLQQGRWQQQGHEAGCQEEVVLYTSAQSAQRSLSYAMEARFLSVMFISLWVYCTVFFIDRCFEHILISNMLLKTEKK